ncbi:MAG TPA: MarR family transcriptional regulator [Pseudonocardiaceae bacterium]|nr:MarR family transcriptional regulator [Pseudonocardiaceae bacterium]
MRADAVAALDKVFALAALLGKEMQEALAERGLTPARAEVLFVLNQQDAMVQRQLSQVLRCTPRHVTALIDALEADGWVTRSPHPTDRRATLVTLTDKGTAAAKRMEHERQQAAQTLFGDLPATDLAGFVAVADHVLRQVGASSGDGAGPGPAGAAPPRRAGGPPG